MTGSSVKREGGLWHSRKAKPKKAILKKGWPQMKGSLASECQGMRSQRVSGLDLQKTQAPFQ